MRNNKHLYPFQCCLRIWYFVPRMLCCPWDNKLSVLFCIALLFKILVLATCLQGLYIGDWIWQWLSVLMQEIFCTYHFSFWHCESENTSGAPSNLRLSLFLERTLHIFSIDLGQVLEFASFAHHSCLTSHMPGRRWASCWEYNNRQDTWIPASKPNDV